MTAVALKLKQFRINSFLTFFILWLILNASLAWDVILVGVLVALGLTHLFQQFSHIYGDVKLHPGIIRNYLAYFVVFLKELVIANIHVARIVVSPNINIKSAIIVFETKLTTPIGRLVLANSISLTPGTLVVDIIGDRLYIHCIDVPIDDPETQTLRVIEKFENHLQVIYG